MKSNDEMFQENARFRAENHEARHISQTAWIRADKKIGEIYEYAYYALSKLLDFITGVDVGFVSSNVSERMALVAQYAQGVACCEELIIQGLYTQAAALLKQEMELIEAIEEIVAGNRKDGATPRIRILKNYGKIYGYLNEISHVSVKNISINIASYEIASKTGAAIVPVHKEQLSEQMLVWHTIFLLIFTSQAAQLFDEIGIKPSHFDEMEYLSYALQQLKLHNILTDVEVK